MRAMGVLPTNADVHNLNHAQWLWLYFNIMKDEEETEDLWKARLDYIGWWINPDLARSIADKDKKKSSKRQTVQRVSSFEGEEVIEEIVTGDIVESSSFEDELQRALAQDGEEFTELPSDDQVGDPDESQEDFIARVAAMHDLLNLQQQITDSEANFGNPNLNNGEIISGNNINEDDLDFFVVPE